MISLYMMTEKSQEKQRQQRKGVSELDDSRSELGRKEE